MNDREFITKFEREKNSFLLKNAFSEKETRALELFENWVKRKIVKNQDKNSDSYNISSRNKTGAPVKRKKGERNEFGRYLEEIVGEARNILDRRGIQSSCISFGDTLRESSKCIKVFKDLNIFYRVCKTWLRKGKYKGQGLLLIELVMDGQKSAVFLPLLRKREVIERHLGIEIDRETDHMEKTGKYRFRICFPHTGNPEDEYEARDIGRILAEFIYITRECIQLLGMDNNHRQNYNIN